MELDPLQENSDKTNTLDIETEQSQHNQQIPQNQYTTCIQFSLREIFIDSLTNLCLQPLLKVNTVFQSQDTHNQINSGQIPRYKGILNTIIRLKQQEKESDILFRGSDVQIYQDLFSYFILYPFTQKIIQKILGGNPFLNQILQIPVLSMIYYPLDLVLAKVQGDIPDKNQNLKYMGVSDCIQQIYEQEGIRGFYKNFGGIMISIWIPSLISRIFMGQVLQKQQQIFEFVEKYVSNPIIIQGIILLFSQGIDLILYPLELVQKRLLVQSQQVEGQGTRVQYNGFIDCFKQIIQKEGVKGLYKGILSQKIIDILRGIIKGSLQYIIIGFIDNNFQFEGRYWRDGQELYQYD